MEDIILGIDVGATGTKGALVDINTGTLASDRVKYLTPKPALLGNVTDTIQKIVTDLNWEGKAMGIGFPSIIKNGICRSATNIDKTFIGIDLQSSFNQAFNTDVSIINDADAAGIAEITYGDYKNHSGTVLFLTLGTGIGSALFYNGKLVPNIELGVVKWKKGIAERYASNSARENKDLSWKEWGQELNEFLQYLEILFTPDVIILGGGVSKKFHKYKDHLKTNCPVDTATLLNIAGIVGAAYVQKKERQK